MMRLSGYLGTDPQAITRIEWQSRAVILPPPPGRERTGLLLDLPVCPVASPVCVYMGRKGARARARGREKRCLKSRTALNPGSWRDAQESDLAGVVTMAQIGEGVVDMGLGNGIRGGLYSGLMWERKSQERDDVAVKDVTIKYYKKSLVHGGGESEGYLKHGEDVSD